MKNNKFFLKVLYSFLIITLFILPFSCKKNILKKNYYDIPTRDGEAINVVIEIPAGASHTVEYQSEERQFRKIKRYGREGAIDFLPYPGNFGFIPSTFIAEETRGGFGDALDVLVLSASEKMGDVVKVIPIAALIMKEADKKDVVLIAVPFEKEKQIIKATSFESLLIEYDAAKRIIETWFLNYKGLGKVELVGWENGNFAWEEIRQGQMNVQN